MTFKGRVWKFGDDVNTDLIIPGRYLDNYDPSYLAKHAMEGASKEFATAARTGDIIIAGRNFGCGSSREQAVIALKSAGVSAVVAKSFARIFYRNAINLGLPVLESETACDSFSDGDISVVDLNSRSLSSADESKKTIAEEIPPIAAEILACGGLIPYIKRRINESREVQ